jgi:hypothetical protein
LTYGEIAVSPVSADAMQPCPIAPLNPNRGK